MKTNYQLELDKIIADNEARGVRPKLLLHGCCAPCSSYCLEYLSKYFDTTLFFCNPNISPKEEYQKRLEEAQRLVKELKVSSRISFADDIYAPESFFEAAKGLENCSEGGARCEKCFALRLSRSAKYAKQHGFDYVSTTLSISPLKNAELLNRIGMKEADAAGIKWLPSDFKKRNGYLRSIELSKDYNLYRQNYCGCVFSRAQAQSPKK